MKKKILIVVPNDSLGGAEQYLRMVAIHFKNEDVSIIHFNKFKGTTWFKTQEGVPQKFMSQTSEKLGLLKFIFSTFNRNKKYDYIFSSHIFVNSLVGFLLNIGLLKSKRFIARESTSIFLRFKGVKLFLYKSAYRFGYKKIDLLICQTELMKQQLVKHFPRINRETVVEVIPNPIDLEQIKKKASEPFNTPLPDNYIITAGRLIEVKGYDILIDAFHIIKKEYPQLKLVILGKGHLHESLTEQANNLGLKDEVLLAGHVDNVYRYFEGASLCVVSSRIEGFPNVLLQMMTQNNNVVSTKCAGGIDEIPGVITAETHNVESLSTGMLKALRIADNKENRSIFNQYLEGRNINAFINKVLSVNPVH